MKFLFLILFFVNTCLAEELKIGILTTHTGPLSEIGDDCRRGVQAAVNTLAPNNKIGLSDLKLVYGDNQSDAKTAINEFKKLTEQDKVLAVVSLGSKICLPLNPISKQKHIPLICGSGHPKFRTGNEYAYQSWAISEDESKLLADYAISKNIKEVAIITGEDEWLLSYTSNFTKHFESKGGKVIASETILLTDSDPSSMLIKIKQKKPSAIFINLTLAQNTTAIRRTKELDFKMPIFTNFWSADQSALKVAGDASEGIIFTEADLDFPEFNTALSKIPNSKKPSGATLSCFASTSSAILAAKSRKIKASYDMQKALLDLKKIDALDISVPVSNRHFVFKVALKQILNMKVVKIN